MSRRPYNPAYKFIVSIGGQTFTQADPGGIEHMVIEDHVDMIGVARLTFNHNLKRWSSMQVGQPVSVALGEGGRGMFVGLVTGFRHSKKRGHETLTVMAMDPLVKAASSRNTKTYEKMTDSAIVGQVLGRAGLAPGRCQGTAKVNDYVFQRNESDLEFMKRLAARNNYVLMAREGLIDFAKAQYQGGSTKIEDERVVDLDYTLNVANIPPSVKSSGWDYVQKLMVEGTAGSGDIERIGKGPCATELAARIYQGVCNITDVQLKCQQSAKGQSSAELNRKARQLIKGTAVVEGNSDVYAGSKVEFTGYRTGYNAEVYVVSSKHTIEFKKGYVTEVQFCSNCGPT